MRYTHSDMQRKFKVPCGIWLIPTTGALLCILLLIPISKETYYYFLVWTAIGQIIYFSYGFWYSNKRRTQKTEPVNSTSETVATVEDIMMKSSHN